MATIDPPSTAAASGAEVRRGSPSGGAPSSVELRYEVPAVSEHWVLPEGTVPDAGWHDRTIDLICDVLRPRIEPEGKAVVYRNLAIRFDASRPQLGFDPDVCIVDPAPPPGPDLESLRLWLPEHPPPRLCVEVVSRNHPYKDYAETPRKCAGVGVEELVMFDPLLVGPKADGGPFRLQVWRWVEAGAFARVFTGSEGAPSSVLDAWFVTIADGSRLRVADDAAGTRLWPTPDEIHRLEGELSGRARALLAVLESRGLPIDEAHRARLLGSRDTALLERWLTRAATCESVDDLLR